MPSRSTGYNFKEIHRARASKQVSHRVPGNSLSIAAVVGMVSVVSPPLMKNTSCPSHCCCSNAILHATAASCRPVHAQNPVAPSRACDSTATKRRAAGMLVHSCSGLSLQEALLSLNATLGGKHLCLGVSEPTLRGALSVRWRHQPVESHAGDSHCRPPPSVGICHLLPEVFRH